MYINPNSNLLIKPKLEHHTGGSGGIRTHASEETGDQRLLLQKLSMSIPIIKTLPCCDPAIIFH